MFVSVGWSETFGSCRNLTRDRRLWWDEGGQPRRQDGDEGAVLILTELSMVIRAAVSRAGATTTIRQCAAATTTASTADEGAGAGRHALLGESCTCMWRCLMMYMQSEADDVPHACS